jgi:hypothetical protein
VLGELVSPAFGKRSVDRIGWLKAVVLADKYWVALTASLIVGVATAGEKDNDVLWFAIFVVCHVALSLSLPLRGRLSSIRHHFSRIRAGKVA